MDDNRTPELLDDKEKRRLVLKRRMFYIIVLLDIVFICYLVYQFITLFAKK